jgi:DNA-binding IclR family transcriptional regulator
MANPASVRPLANPEDEAPETKDKYNVKIVERCFDILDLAARSEAPLTVQLVCAELGLNSNMAFRLLATMTKSGYVEKDEHNGHYSISMKALRLSRRALQSIEMRKVILPCLELLWNQFPKANLNLALYYQGDIVVVDRIDSVNLPRTYSAPGKTLPFHCTGLGKILTSELPEAELDALIARQGLKAYTPATIVDPARFKEELAKVRREGIARDRAEFIPNDNCNAVAVRDSSRRIIAAISLSAFESYMPVEEVEATIEALIATARRISDFMGFSDWQ